MTRFLKPMLLLLLVAVWCLPVAAVELDGPTEPIEAGEYCQIFVRDMADDDLPKARVIYWPRNRVIVVPAKTWGGEAFIWFGARVEGVYLLAVAVPRDNVLDYAETTIIVGKGDDDVDPDPPPPPPPPPGPIQEMTVLVVEETSVPRTEEQVQMLACYPCRKWLTDNGHRLRVVDRDVKDQNGQVPADLARFIDPPPDASRYVFVVDGDGAVHWEGPLSNFRTLGEFQNLWKEYGAEK